MRCSDVSHSGRPPALLSGHPALRALLSALLETPGEVVFLYLVSSFNTNHA